MAMSFDGKRLDGEARGVLARQPPHLHGPAGRVGHGAATVPAPVYGAGDREVCAAGGAIYGLETNSRARCLPRRAGGLCFLVMNLSALVHHLHHHHYPALRAAVVIAG